MVTRKLIRITSPEAAALAAKETSIFSSAAAEDLTTVNKQPPTHLTNGSVNKNGGGKKRAVSSSGDLVSGKETTSKRQRADGFVIDLTDVPPQLPILKNKGRLKEGASKYAGIYFNKTRSKWQARIKIEGKTRHIGYYVNEEEAAINYARAVFKYKSQEALEKRKQRKPSVPAINIDLSDVPIQPPIPMKEGRQKEGACDRYIKEGTTLLANGKDNRNETGGGKKRPVPSEDALLSRGEEITKRQRSDKFVIDLTDVPPQLPILKSKVRVKEGASKYTGVSFCKASNKWEAKIAVFGKRRRIGYYENEEEAAIDYARTVFKYKGQDALDKAREQKKSAPAMNIDLSNVPSISPILKSAGGIKEGSSKYAGVTFNKAMNKWEAQIIIEGKQYFIGYYEKDEVAATDYARALFKYKGHDALNEASKRKSSAPAIDLSDVPQQLPILKSEGNIKRGTSKYVGVNFDKVAKKWKTVIRIDRKLRHIGYYENEEEAAIDYARALFKYNGQEALDKVRERKFPAISIDLSDVPQQPPILKSIEGIKEGSSKYLGVYFDKSAKKWSAKIVVDGMLRHISYYENEEEAAADYARAVFKYKGQEALDKAREQNKSISPTIDLSDVPPQQPILRYDGHIIKEGFSKYVGVSFKKRQNKWQARITIDGKERHIGYYENEEEAAIDYARAVFKYISQEALDQVRE